MLFHSHFHTACLLTQLGVLVLVSYVPMGCASKDPVVVPARQVVFEEVTGQGFGSTAQEALNNAMVDAVRHVTGTLVATGRRVDQGSLDEFIHTHANGFIFAHQPIVPPFKSGSGDNEYWQVHIRAWVKKARIFEELKVRNMLDRDLEDAIGPGGFDSVRILSLLMKDWPYEGYTATPVGRWEVRSRNGRQMLTHGVRFSIDPNSYRSFHNSLLELLDVVAEGKEVKGCQFSGISLATVAENFEQRFVFEKPWGDISVAETDHREFTAVDFMESVHRFASRDTFYLVSPDHGVVRSFALRRDDWEAIADRLFVVPVARVALLANDGLLVGEPDTGSFDFHLGRGEKTGDLLNWSYQAGRKSWSAKEGTPGARLCGLTPVQGLTLATWGAALAGQEWAAPYVDVDFFFELDGNPHDFLDSCQLHAELKPDLVAPPL